MPVRWMSTIRPQPSCSPCVASPPASTAIVAPLANFVGQDPVALDTVDVTFKRTSLQVLEARVDAVEASCSSLTDRTARQVRASTRVLDPPFCGKASETMVWFADGQLSIEHECYH